MKKIICLIVTAGLFTLHASAQHEHHMPEKDTSKPKASDTTMQTAGDTAMMHHDHSMMSRHTDMGNMTHAFSLNLPMTRNGSGTGWLPDASPMYGTMYHTKYWMYMLHSNLFLRYNNQDFTNKGFRGDSKFDAPNWLMFMGQRKVGKGGLFHFNTMFSLDAATGGSGYPLLFQSGEAYKGKPLVDRQQCNPPSKSLLLVKTSDQIFAK